jgi:hypothetical protein
MVICIYRQRRQIYYIQYCPIMLHTGRFIMFSPITNIYNKKTKGPTLMESFTATGKLEKFFLTTGDVRYVHHGWHGTHRYDIQVLATHASTLVHRYSSLLQWSVWTTMKNSLLGKQILNCSFYLYRFRKYLSCGFPIINFCNPGVHYETPCISVCTTIFRHKCAWFEKINRLNALKIQITIDLLSVPGDEFHQNCLVITYSLLLKHYETSKSYSASKIN